MTASLEAFQRRFAAGLRHGDDDTGDDPALTSQPGFAVYRNTVATACIDALAANHPTVREIVGDDWFFDAARIHQRAEPPRDGRLALYGERFADFLRTFAPAAGLPYLADVARFDRLWSESHVAADAPVLAAVDLARVDPQTLASSTLVPHPAARWAWSASCPAFEIWRRHREARDLDAELDWHGDGGILVRPHDTVRWLAVEGDGIAFLDACAAGEPFATAADAVGERIAALWPALVAAGAFSRLEPGSAR